MRALLFGASSAVHSFKRAAQALEPILTEVFGIPCARNFVDFTFIVLIKSDRERSGDGDRGRYEEIWPQTAVRTPTGTSFPSNFQGPDGSPAAMRELRRDRPHQGRLQEAQVAPQSAALL